MKVKTIVAVMFNEIPDPTKRLICGVLRQAVHDYQHPTNPKRALDASVFLLEDAKEWAGFCGLKVDQSYWEALIARL